MRPIPIRLPESMADALEAEAADRELSLAEYCRQLLRRRDELDLNQQSDPSDAEMLVKRLDEIESRLASLEAAAGGGDFDANPRPSSGGDGAAAVVEYVRDQGPVSRSDIVEAFTAEIDELGIKPESWWKRRARPTLNEAGAEFVRNVGWRLSDGADGTD